MMDAQHAVLILDGDENQAVASVRDLGKAGYRVFTADSFRWPKASLSRYSRESFVYRSPRADRAGFLEDLLTFIHQQGERDIVLLPMTETTTLVLSEEREALEAAGYRLVLPSHSSLLRAFDKEQTSKIATAAGVDVPQQVVVQKGSEIDSVAKLQMPVVVKATASNVMVGGRQVAAPRPRYASSLPEANRLAVDLLTSGFPAVAQEFIQGVGVGFFALYERGVLRRSFAHQRIRDVHPTGSGSSYRMSIDVDSELLSAGTAILDSLEWHGAAMVEFKRQSNGRLVFLEVNGRLWGSLSLAVSAGAHFPRWLVRLATNQDMAPEPVAYERIHSRWILGEFRHLFAVMKGRPRGFPGRFPTRTSTLRAMITGLRTDRFDNFEPTDPLPELGDWLSAARKAVRVSTQKLFGRFT